MADTDVVMPARETPDIPEALQPPTQQVSLRFTLALTAAAMSLYVLWAGIGSLLLPYQIGLFAPEQKVVILSFFTSVTVLIALVANPLAGALSDRTTSRFGRRRPWIFVGGILTAVGLFLLWRAGSILLLFVAYCIVELFSNCVLATLNATIPDQVPDNQRGTVSGFFGLATSLGGILGAVIGGQIFTSAPTNAYIVMLLIVLVTNIPFALLLRDKALPKEYAPPFHLGAFLKNFWVNPRAHPDFAWAWVSRFIPYMGYYLGITYILYYLQDAVKHPAALQGASTFNIIASGAAILTTLLGGFLSDRVRRYKIFVAIGMGIMAVAMFVLAFFHIWLAVLVAAIILGFGLGAFLGVSTAIVTLVLPSAETRAKDMGIINIANTLPHSLAPVMAGFILGLTSGDYTLLYIGAGIFLLLGIFTVFPIKAVR